MLGVCETPSTLSKAFADMPGRSCAFANQPKLMAGEVKRRIWKTANTIVMSLHGTNIKQLHECIA